MSRDDHLKRGDVILCHLVSAVCGDKSACKLNVYLFVFECLLVRIINHLLVLHSKQDKDIEDKVLKYIQNNKDLMTEILQYKVWKAAFEEKQLTIVINVLYCVTSLDRDFGFVMCFST